MRYVLSNQQYLFQCLDEVDKNENFTLLKKFIHNFGRFQRDVGGYKTIEVKNPVDLFSGLKSIFTSINKYIENEFIEKDTFQQIAENCILYKNNSKVQLYNFIQYFLLIYMTQK